MSNVQDEFGQEVFKWGISNSYNSQACLKRMEKKQQLPYQQLEIMKENSKEDKKRKKRNEEEEEEWCEHEMHIWTERERRKKMRDMFSKLHALLPQLPPKADKSTIVDEAVNSIKSLEQTLHKLQMKKLEKLQFSSSSNTTFAYDPSSSLSNQPQILTLGLTASDNSHLADQISSYVTLPYPCNDPITMFDTWSSRNVVLNICGNEAFFNLCCPKDISGVFITLCYLFDKYNIEVLFASVSSNVCRRNYMIQAQVNSSYENQFLRDGFEVGDIFKQVAQELVLYFSSP